MDGHYSRHFFLKSDVGIFFQQCSTTFFVCFQSLKKKHYFIRENYPQFLEYSQSILITLQYYYSYFDSLSRCRDVVFRENKTKQHNFNFDGTHDIFLQIIVRIFLYVSGSFSHTKIYLKWTEISFTLVIGTSLFIYSIPLLDNSPNQVGSWVHYPKEICFLK